MRESLDQVQKVLQCLTSERRVQLIYLALLMVLASIAEAVSIGSIIPLLAILVSPDKLIEYKYFNLLAELLGITDRFELAAYLTVVFCLMAIFSAALRVALVASTAKLSALIGVDLSRKVFETIIKQPYSSFIKKSSGEKISILQKTNHLTYSLIQPALTIVSSLVMLLIVGLILILVNPLIAGCCIVSLGVIYFTLQNAVARKLSQISKRSANAHDDLNKAIQESLVNIREIVLTDSAEIYIDKFSAAYREVQRANQQANLIGQCPRYLVEASAIVIIASLAYYLLALQGPYKSTTSQLFLPVLAGLALGVQRLLPLGQQIYSAVVLIRSSSASVREAISFLEIPKSIAQRSESSQEIFFRGSIKFRNVSFSYNDNNRKIISNLTCEITRGMKVAVVGPSGSGKSTFLDLLAGLICPTEGTIYIDQDALTDENIRHWHRFVAHLPQNVYLADASVAENITFPFHCDPLNFDRIIEAAQLAHIADDIDRLDAGYESQVGERGVFLSGGQRQRLGLARVYYQNPDVLILDEPTSAVDRQTTTEIFHELTSRGKGQTIFVATHNLLDFSKFDLVLDMESQLSRE